MRKVLITGAAGYIGSVLTRQLLRRGDQVRGFDNLSFGGESLLSVFADPRFEFVRGDIRDPEDVKKAISGVDAVIHLAAIVGDPACSKQPEIAKEINWDGSIALFEACNSSDSIRNFVFASTCSNYGKMADVEFITESSPLNPVSLYAKLKVKFEDYLRNESSRIGMSTTSLRFSTVYGLSPRMRFDLTVNEFMRDVALGNELVVYGEQFWRPYCHVEDLAASCSLILDSDPKLVEDNVFGVGDTSENYQKKMLVEEILKIQPDALIKFVKKDEDPRDYRVDFSKIRDELGFSITKTVPQGLGEIQSAIMNGMVDDPYSIKHSNIVEVA